MPTTSPAGTHPSSPEAVTTATELGLGGESNPRAVTPPPPPLFSGRKPTSTTSSTAGDEAPGSPADFAPAGNGTATTWAPPTSSSPGSTDHDLDEPDWTDPDAGKRTAAADRVALLNSPELVDGIAAGVHAIGDELNDRIAPGTDLFLTDANDEQGLAKPLSRLALRHLPNDLGAAGNPDLADALTAAIVLVRYAVKQLNVMRALRRTARAAAADGRVPYGTGPVEPEPAGAPA